MTACQTVEPGPPQGCGHYSQDGRWWWDDDQGQWFRTTPDTDVLQIELEDYGNSRWWRSALTTLVNQYGTMSYRFVGRATSVNRAWPTYAVASGTFPLLPGQLPIDELDERSAFAPGIHAELATLQDHLARRGWQRLGAGEHWWSTIYRRAAVDWGTPAGAYEDAHVAAADGECGGA